MFLFAVLVFGILALAPQAVFSLSFNFTFQLPEVEQCKPVSLTLTGNSYGYANDSSMALTLIPFNSIPISIPIPETPYNISGVNVTFFPFAQGTTFIASLDDSSGQTIAQVSNVSQVLPSPAGNGSCLSGTVAGRLSNYTLDNSTFSQCEAFTLKYNHSVISQAPSVRVYIPGGSSHILNLTTDDQAGTATYLLSVKQGKEVVMVFDGGEVGGDSSSSNGCLEALQRGSQADTSSNSQLTGKPATISLPIIIGVSIAGGVIAVIAICMVVFVRRERQRKRQVDPESHPSLIDKDQPPTSGLEEKRMSPTPTPTFMPQPALTPPPTLAGYSPHILNDPIYIPGREDLRGSMSSWSQPISNDKRPSGMATSPTYSIHGGELSFESLDIEAMLNMAAVASNRSSNQSDEPVPYGSPLHIEPSSSPHLTKKPSRQHVRESADVPHGPESMASALSLTSVVDPFADDAIKRQGQVGLPPSRKNSATSTTTSSSANSSIQSLPRAVVGLPTSPRQGLPLARKRSQDVLGAIHPDLRLSSVRENGFEEELIGVAQ